MPQLLGHLHGAYVIMRRGRVQISTDFLTAQKPPSAHSSQSPNSLPVHRCLQPPLTCQHLSLSWPQRESGAVRIFGQSARPAILVGQNYSADTCRVSLSGNLADMAHTPGPEWGSLSLTETSLVFWLIVDVAIQLVSFADVMPHCFVASNCSAASIACRHGIAVSSQTFMSFQRPAHDRMGVCTLPVIYSQAYNPHAALPSHTVHNFLTCCPPADGLCPFIHPQDGEVFRPNGQFVLPAHRHFLPGLRRLLPRPPDRRDGAGRGVGHPPGQFPVQAGAADRQGQASSLSSCQESGMCRWIN